MDPVASGTQTGQRTLLSAVFLYMCKLVVGNTIFVLEYLIIKAKGQMLTMVPFVMTGLVVW